jgi:hypothetical protein
VDCTLALEYPMTKAKHFEVWDVLSSAVKGYPRHNQLVSRQVVAGTHKEAIEIATGKKVEPNGLKLRLRDESPRTEYAAQDGFVYIANELSEARIKDLEDQFRYEACLREIS